MRGVERPGYGRGGGKGWLRMIAGRAPKCVSALFPVTHGTAQYGAGEVNALVCSS